MNPRPPSKKAPEHRPGDRVLEAEFAAGATDRAQFPPPAIAEVAFAGRSNVGKSSLLNCLLERRGLVRTSQTPGCTRQVSWFRAKADDGALLDLVDLPGYGFAKRSKVERRHWGELIDSYLTSRITLRGVVVLVDVRRGIEEDDLELVRMLEEPPVVSRAPLEVVLVATKLDKLSVAQQKPRLAEIAAAAGRPVLGFSAETRTGREVLWRKLRRIAGVEQQTPTVPVGDV